MITDEFKVKYRNLLRSHIRGAVRSNEKMMFAVLHLLISFIGHILLYGCFLQQSMLRTARTTKLRGICSAIKTDEKGINRQITFMSSELCQVYLII